MASANRDGVFQDVEKSAQHKPASPGIQTTGEAVRQSASLFYPFPAPPADSQGIIQPDTDSSGRAAATEKQQLERQRATGLGDATIITEIRQDDRLAGFDDYPDGGLRAWSVVAGAWCCMFPAFTLLNIGGVYQEYITRHQLVGVPESTVAWIFSINVFVAFFFGLQVGPCFDALGPRVLVVLGTISNVLGFFLLAQSTQLWHFILSFGILCGLGTSFLMTPSIACIGHWFNKRRGLATGIGCTAGSVGGVTFCLTLPILFDKVGYAWGTRIAGFAFLATLIAANLLLRPRLPRKQSLNVWDFLPNFRIFAGGRGEFAFCTAGVFAMEWGFFIPLTYLASWALHTGAGTSGDTTGDGYSMFGTKLLAILSGASFFGRCCPGYFADRIGPFNTMVMVTGLCLISLLCFWLPASVPGSPVWGSVPLAVLFSVTFGFGSGSWICLVPVCCGKLCSIDNYGRYYSTCYTVVSLGCLTGVPIAGALLEACDGEYTGVIAFSSAAYAVGVTCFITARVLHAGWGLKTVC